MSAERPGEQRGAGGRETLARFWARGNRPPRSDDAWTRVPGNTMVPATRFDLIVGAPHYIDEAIYHPREAAWAWMRGFILNN